MHDMFIQIKYLVLEMFYANFIEICSQGSNQQRAITDSDNALEPYWRQTIIWTNWCWSSLVTSVHVTRLWWINHWNDNAEPLFNTLWERSTTHVTHWGKFCMHQSVRHQTSQMWWLGPKYMYMSHESSRQPAKIAQIKIHIFDST